MGEVFRLYAIVIVEFLAELLVFCVLFLRGLPRPRGFWGRLPLSVLLLFALGIPVALFYTSFGETVYGRILVYLVLFAALILLAFWCYRSFYAVLFRCTLAYAAQNLVYKLFLVFWTGGEAFRIFDGWENFDLCYRLVYYSFFAFFATVVYFLFVRGITRRLGTCRLDHRMLAITVFVLGITVLLCSFEDVFFAKLSVGRENRFENDVYVVLRQTGNIFSAVCCVIVFLLASKTVVASELSREVEYLRYAIRQGERQYRISKDTIDLINIKCHDIRYKLALAAKSGNAPDLEELKEHISIYDSRIETGSPLLNVLLTEKSLFCEQNKISLSCMIDGGKLSFLEDGDLYCLFGNLLDNALEAVEKISDPERRVVDLTVKAKDGLLLVQEENYFEGELSFRDGLPVTSKGEDYHGFGMRSLRLIVRKYGGELSAFAQGDVFHLNIIFGING